MKFEHTQVWGFEHALRGMRNPKESWDRSDSYYEPIEEYLKHEADNAVRAYIIGEKDMELAQKLIRAGSPHRKFMRQIFVSVDIVAPLYWWKHFDTYNVGTTTNSTSTMHKLAETPITPGRFEMDDYDASAIEETFTAAEQNNSVLDRLEELRQRYVETKDKKYWKELVRWLPESWLYRETTTMNYENVYSMVCQRKCHKMNEWSGIDRPDLENFVSWARSLPYAQEMIFLDESNRSEE